MSCKSNGIYKGLSQSMVLPGGSVVKNPPTPVQESRVLSLDRRDSLEKKMTTHSSILAWEISRTEKPGRLQPMRSQKESDMFSC